MAASKYAGLRAGQLRDLLEIQARVERIDASGALLPADWRTVGRCWADIQPTSGLRRSEQERIIGEQLFGSSLYIVTIRFRTDLTEKHRLVIVGPPKVFLNIKTPPQDPDGRRRKLSMTCESGLVEG